MKDPVFKLDNWEPMFPVDDKFAVDLNGHFKMRVGDNLSMDVENGELFFTTPWKGPEDKS